MATITLTLGGVALGTSPGHSGPTPLPDEAVTGSSPQWSDGSDGTYAFIVRDPFVGGGTAHAPADPVEGNLLAVTATIRASSDPSAVGSTATTRLNVWLTNFAVPAAIVTDDVEFPNDGAVHEVTVAGDMSFPGDNPDGWLAEGSYVEARNLSNYHRINVYEVTVVVTLTDVEVRLPATRMYPRDDPRGLGSPRLYPHPKSGRVVGGYP